MNRLPSVLCHHRRWQDIAESCRGLGSKKFAHPFAQPIDERNFRAEPVGIFHQRQQHGQLHHAVGILRTHVWVKIQIALLNHMTLTAMGQIPRRRPSLRGPIAVLRLRPWESV